MKPSQLRPRPDVNPAYVRRLQPNPRFLTTASTIHVCSLALHPAPVIPTELWAIKMATSVDAKLLRQTKFPPEFSRKVDMTKVNIEVMKK